nr:zinc metallopeptidase [Paraflavitalea speifideiaquila]
MGFISWSIVNQCVPCLIIRRNHPFGLTTLFSVITLPVEFDASNRALGWLNRTNIMNQQEYPKAKDALKWAALTYVVAAVASIATLVQYILIFLGGNRERN